MWTLITNISTSTLSKHITGLKNLFLLCCKHVTSDLAFNEGKSAARFWHKLATWVQDMFCDFYLVKCHKLLTTQQPLKLEKK